MKPLAAALGPVDSVTRQLPNRYSFYFRIMFAILMRAMLDGSDGSTFNATTVIKQQIKPCFILCVGEVWSEV